MSEVGPIVRTLTGDSLTKLCTQVDEAATADRARRIADEQRVTATISRIATLRTSGSAFESQVFSQSPCYVGCPLDKFKAGVLCSVSACISSPNSRCRSVSPGWNRSTCVAITAVNSWHILQHGVFAGCCLLGEPSSVTCQSAQTYCALS